MNAFSRIPALYIADGHHRAASAARARTEIREGGHRAHALGDGADFNTFLAVAFPHDQVQILPYNRIVKDLGGLTEHEFMRAVHDRFTVQAGPAAPSASRRHRDVLSTGTGKRFARTSRRIRRNAIASLDVSVLQDSLLAPILKIADIRTDKRIDFVGGARGTSELEKHVQLGEGGRGVFTVSRSASTN